MYFQAEVDRHNPIKKYEELLKRIASGESVPSKEVSDALAEAQSKINSSTDRYLSEDYLFCQNVRKAGMKVWLCPWMHLQHSGSYVFGGKLPALASIGASATADAELIKKQRAGNAPAAPQPVPMGSADPNLLKKFKKIG